MHKPYHQIITEPPNIIQKMPIKALCSLKKFSAYLKMEIEALLDSLIHSLKSALEPLTGHIAPLLLAALHDTEILPNKNVSEKASEALDLLSEIRLLLEPGHLVLADHFLGTYTAIQQRICTHSILC